MATSSLTTKLRHLLLRSSAVSLAGKLSPAVFTSVHKPVVGCGFDKSVLLGRVDSPPTRSLSYEATKSKVDDDNVDDDDVDVDDVDDFDGDGDGSDLDFDGDFSADDDDDDDDE